MRREFGRLIANELREDSRVYLLAGDVGYGVLDAAFAAAPDRCLNMGASEQAMIGAAVGLSYEGKIPVCYTITPFLLYRPFEWLRNYLAIEGARVKLVGSGRGTDYEDAGYTHWCGEQGRVLESLPGIKPYWPLTIAGVEQLWRGFIDYEGPAYLSLKR
jgi:transketolase